MVSILIGVNDLVQGRAPERYAESLAMIYDAVAATSARAAAVSIPSWSYVPAAADFGGRQRVERLTAIFNAVGREEAERRNFAWIDIGPASTSGIGTKGWIASDQLHPGDAQYAAWAEVIWTAVQDAWTRP